MSPRPNRYPIDLPASFLSEPNGPQALARIENVSTGGILLTRIPKQVAPQDPVWVELGRAGAGRVGLLGRVRWAEQDRAGVSIEAMLPHHRMRFARLLETLAEHG